MASVKEGIDAVYIFPPSTALDMFDCSFKIGCQNAYGFEKGSMTGEIGLEQLEEFEIDTILIGHSERRINLNESQEEIVKKFNFFKENGFEIFYCIGEDLEVREKGIDSVINYLHSQLEGIDLSYDKLFIAYEPVWAIGTGVAASFEDIGLIHKKLKEKFNRPLLYGGSVDENNIKNISNIYGVDGVLVGSASLDAERFASIIHFT